MKLLLSSKQPGNLIGSTVFLFLFCLLLISVSCKKSNPVETNYPGKLANYSLSKEFTAEVVSQVINQQFSNTGVDLTQMIATSTAVKGYTIEYYTTDINGQLIIVSGFVAFPSPANGEYPVVQYHHGSQFNNQDVPSNPDRSVETLLCMAVFAGHGYITSLPDFIGQGKSTVMHPYLHIASEASSCADMLKAVKELSSKLSVQTNSKLFMLGLSQGGQVTLALQQYIETTSSVQPFNLTATAPIAGPYDLPRNWTSWLANPPGCSPVSAHVILAFKHVYGFPDPLIEIFNPPYDTQILSINDGTHDGHQMLHLLPSTMDSLFQADFINAVNAKTHPFYFAMEENIIDNFAAVTPTRLYHSKKDELVPYYTSVDSYNKMRALGAKDIELVELDSDSGYLHEASFQPAVIRAKFWFDTF